MFEQRTFHLVGYFSWNAEKSLNQDKSSKNQLWVLSFSDVFNELLFLYVSSFSPKSVSSSHHWTNTDNAGVLNSPNQISSKPVSNPGQDWRKMQICDSQIFQRQHARPIQISNKIAKFNTWKLIVARWTLYQHNINILTTYFKYLIRQLILTSECDLISATSSNFFGMPVFGRV